MKKFFAIMVVAIVCFAIGFSAAQAAVINVQPAISGILDPTTFEPVPGATFTDKGYAGGHGEVVVQMDIRLTVESLAANEDSFGTAAFSMIINGNATPTLAYDPRPFPNVDSNGNAPGGLVPLFATNADQAVADDYVGILLQMATGAFTNDADPRRNVAEPTGVTLPSGEDLSSGVWVGRAYVQWSGSGASEITLAGSLPGTGPEVSAKSVDGSFILGQSLAVIPVQLGIPEPGTLALAGLSLIGLVFRRRG